MLKISVIYYDNSKRKIQEIECDAAQANLLTPSDNFLRFNGNDWKVVQIIKEVNATKAQFNGEMSITVHVHLRKINEHDVYLMPKND